MKIKKKMWYSLLSVLWIFILVFPVMASEIPEERQKPLLVDEAGLLTEEESSELLNKLEDISQRYENEVGIVLISCNCNQFFHGIFFSFADSFRNFSCLS